MALPNVTADHVAVYNRRTKKFALDYNKNATTADRFASLTKYILAALLAGTYPTVASLEAISLTVSSYAEAIGGAGDSRVQLGDIWNGYQAVIGGMLPSANEIVYQLAQYHAVTNLGASAVVDQATANAAEAAYVAAMNTWASNNGLSITFTSSNGFTPAGESGTAQDLCRMVDLVGDWAPFRAIWADPDYSIQVDITRNSLPFTETLASSLTTINADSRVAGRSKGGVGGGNHLAAIVQFVEDGDEYVIVMQESSDRENEMITIMNQFEIDHPEALIPRRRGVASRMPGTLALLRA